jgi:hypothetical protein
MLIDEGATLDKRFHEPTCTKGDKLKKNGAVASDAW